MTTTRPSRSMLSVRIPDHLIVRLKTWSLSSRIPVQELVETWLVEKLDEVGARPAATPSRPAPEPRTEEEDRVAHLEDKVDRLADAITRLVEHQAPVAPKRKHG